VIKKLIIAFLALSILELVITSYFGAMLGGTGTLIWCIATAVIGFYIIKRNTSFFTGNMVSNIASSMYDNRIWPKIIIAIGGILLILPGFITDILAVAFILPITRNLILIPLVRFIINKVISKLF